MNRSFNLIKNYYDSSFELYKKDTITINEGITTLVGCNGSGKTTLLNIIKEQLEKENVPCMDYNNLNDGGHYTKDKLAFYSQFEQLAQRVFSSEGEEIILNIGDFISQIRTFFKTGKSNHSFKEPNPNHKERWIIFDAVDSGMSIDNMKEVKDVFKLIVNDAKAKGIELYIIISTNSYEFAKDNACFDVYEGEYTSFNNYDEYSNFIINSRTKKDNR